MILPIVAYGDPVLKREAEEIEQDYPELNTLIENMFETMYNARGLGLAAPQIGESIRLFIVDTSPFAEDIEEEEDPERRKELESLANFKEVFINPIMVEEEGKPWAFSEGCLSIPGITEDVFREPTITIEYFNRNFELKEETFTGLKARVIQHEYDHIEGILFTDKLSPIKRQFLRKKLIDIAKGKTDAHYKMRFPKLKK